MTKSLTEQWREGTLPDGKYYIKLEPNFAERYDVGYSEDGDFALYNIEDIEEVLAPVPSYEECQRLVSKADESVQKIHILNEQNTKNYNELCEEIKKNNRLEKQLAIATKALKEYADKDKWEHCSPDWRDAEEALKEMEGVK
jgi:hypothetical protein